MSDFGQFEAQAEGAETEREAEVYFGGSGGIMSCKRFSEYNELLKENEKLYRNAVKNVGFPTVPSGYCIFCGTAERT